MAFTDQATLADDPAFRAKVRVATVTAAKDILGEAKGGFSDTKFGKRQSLADQVITNSGSFVDRFAWAVAASPAISAGSSDSDIQFTVNSVWDDLAGVRITD